MSERKKHPKPSPRIAFEAGLTEWFHRADFNVGLNIQAMDTEKDVAVIKKLVNVAKVVIDFGGPTGISKGAGSEELLHGLTPFIPLADLVASKVIGPVVIVPLVIFADDLAFQPLRERLETFMTLAEPLNQFGAKLNSVPASNQARLYPLLVYFNRDAHAAARNALLPYGWRAKYWKRIFLRVGIVSVSEDMVTWAEQTGYFAAVVAIVNFFGKDGEFFHYRPADLKDVQVLADQKAVKSQPVETRPKRAQPRCGRGSLAPW